jgi:hypothetical protein
MWGSSPTYFGVLFNFFDRLTALRFTATGVMQAANTQTNFAYESVRPMPDNLWN